MQCKITNKYNVLHQNKLQEYVGTTSVWTNQTTDLFGSLIMLYCSIVLRLCLVKIRKQNKKKSNLKEMI